MTRFAEWLWRLSLLAAVLWVGWELHQFHLDFLAPADDGSTVSAASDPDPESLDDLRSEVATLNDKLNALAAVVATRLR